MPQATGAVVAAAATVAVAVATASVNRAPAVPSLGQSASVSGLSDPSMPLPFTRSLSLQTPPLHGTDVYILRGLLGRHSAAPSVVGGCTTVSKCPFDTGTAAALRSVQTEAGLPATGALDGATASHVLDTLGSDGHRWNGTAPGALGYKYLVRCPVSANRSVETTCALHAANGTSLFEFTARLHGASRMPPPPWPEFDSDGPGVNEFTSDGCTPTGLVEFDLNSPEDEPKEFGPYPVNRATVGLEGNAALLLTNTADAPRGGILMHTGEWTCCGWAGPPAPMPNSLGCIHAYPESIHTVWKLLTTELGVEVRPNTNGAAPYPYRSQGLLSVELVAPARIS